MYTPSELHRVMHEHNRVQFKNSRKPIKSFQSDFWVNDQKEPLLRTMASLSTQCMFNAHFNVTQTWFYCKFYSFTQISFKYQNEERKKENVSNDGKKMPFKNALLICGYLNFMFSKLWLEKTLRNLKKRKYEFQPRKMMWNKSKTNCTCRDWNEFRSRNAEQQQTHQKTHSIYGSTFFFSTLNRMSISALISYGNDR